MEEEEEEKKHLRALLYEEDPGASVNVSRVALPTLG